MKNRVIKGLITLVCCMLLITCSYNNGFHAGKREGETQVVYRSMPKFEFKPSVMQKEKVEDIESTETAVVEKVTADIFGLNDKSISVEAELISLGHFISYGYDACYDCCGKTPDHPAYGITASGTRATKGRTIAVDPSVIPLGSEVIINGHTYIAEDTGTGIVGKTVDIYYNTHSAAFNHGRQMVEVFVRR